MILELRSTETVSKAIDDIIDEVHVQLAKHELPAFVAREKWQENQQYSSYPDWMHLDTETAMEKLEQQFPEAYKKLKGE